MNANFRKLKSKGFKNIFGQWMKHRSLIFAVKSASICVNPRLNAVAFVFLLGFAAPLWAGSENLGWVIQAAGGFDVYRDAPTWSFSSRDASLDGSVGYRWADDFTLSVEGGYHNLVREGPPNFNEAAERFYYFPVALKLQRNILISPGFEFFTFLGAGMAFNQYWTANPPLGMNSTKSSHDPLLEPGVGFTYNFVNLVMGFIQVRGDWDFAQGYPDGINDPFFTSLELGVTFPLNTLPL